MATGSFTEHAKACPHIAQIERLYAPVETLGNVVAFDSQYGQPKDGAKKAMLLGEMRALYDVFGCDGVVNGTCPLLEKKSESSSRQSVASVGNKLLRVLSRNKGE
jgi:hypothetical protein